jgi:glutamate-ammonia-ligase adenylyltransferase
LFYANPALLDLVAEIMGSAPRLSNRLSHQPILLDSVLSSDFFEPLDSEGELAADLEEMLAQASDFQDVLDFTRRWVSGHEFQIGVQLLRGRCSAEDAGRTMAGLADAALLALKLGVESEFVKRHGRVPGGSLGVIALGKLGGRELTAESDLDLVFVYDHDTDAELSDGPAPLSPGTYYSRLSQRFITAITTLTPEGQLYDVDMRLRPSGAAGPIAAPLEGFARYLHESAWTWEHMALTRARIIATPDSLKEQLQQTICRALTDKRDADRLVIDVADMRHRIDKEHNAPSLWDIKHRRGGLVDLEFIAQYLQLRHASTNSSVLSARTDDALKQLAEAGHLEEQTTDELSSALALWQRLQAMLRLTLAENPDVEAAPRGLRRVLVRTAKVRSFVGLKRAMDDAAQRVVTHYQRLIEDPADAARGRIESAKPSDSTA